MVHPQSIVHALVHLNDGASLAHLGYPDMRVPISYALHYPERADVPVETLDLAAVGELTFEAPDSRPSPACASPARPPAAGGTAPCVLNAANEVAVHAFLAGGLRFTGIAAGDRAHARGAARPGRCATSRPLQGRRRGPRAGRRARRRGVRRVSWFLAFVGFALLVILHELGHFMAAKAVGMRVERFSLFFPPLIARKKARRDRVRDRRDPVRRLREDQRDEPGREAPGGGRARAPTTSSPCGSGWW